MFDLFKKKQSGPKYLFYVIDDEEKVLDTLATLIEMTFPCKVKKFTTLESAVDSLGKETLAPDLIFSDIKMGRESGLSIRDRLKEMGANIPVLFITGLAGEEGFHNGYWSINKPVSAASLKKYTNTLLNQAKR